MYGKLIQGQIYYAPKKIEINNSIVYNPTGSQLESLGYKIINVIPQPEYSEGYHLEPIWSETNVSIIKSWEIVKNPEEDEDSSDSYDSEILNIILGIE